LVPIIILTSASSILIILLALPLFISVYYSERLGGCRYLPTCKEYMIGALESHGLIKGFWLSVKRTLRCSPLFVPGYDPVPTPRTPWSSAIGQDTGKLHLTKSGILLATKGVLFLSFWLGLGTWLLQKILLTFIGRFSGSGSRILYFLILVIGTCITQVAFGYIGYSLLKRSWVINIFFYAVAVGAIASYHFLL
jgi:putative membrane protein insertion efficiency factor